MHYKQMSFALATGKQEKQHYNFLLAPGFPGAFKINEHE
jgi:hypothetical protein